MAWKVSGQSLELCSCKMLYPCWLGPEGAPDQGWCAGAFALTSELVTLTASISEAPKL
jgi:hypothetical protein